MKTGCDLDMYGGIMVIFRAVDLPSIINAEIGGSL